MNLRDLKYLIAVAEYKHFGKAAEACYVSQPALSMQIKKLEEELGVSLFERTNKSVMLTPAGDEILVRAKYIIQTEQEIKNLSAEFQDPFGGEIKLGTFPTLAPYYFPKIVPNITKKYKNLTLLLVEEKTSILLNMLKKGEIDAAFLALPIEDDTLEYKELFEDDFVLATSTSHPLSDRKEIKNSDLSGECLLLLKDGHCLRDQALDVCSLTGSCARQDFQATSLETLRQMVISSVGITLIPKIAQLESKGIKYIPFAKPAPSRKIALVWRKSSTRKKCLQGIMDIVG